MRADQGSSCGMTKFFCPILGSFNLRFVHETCVIVVLPFAMDNRTEGASVTCAETWVYSYDTKTTCQVQSKTKVMLVTYFDCVSIVHHDCSAQSQTMNLYFHYKC